MYTKLNLPYTRHSRAFGHGGGLGSYILARSAIYNFRIPATFVRGWYRGRHVRRRGWALDSPALDSPALYSPALDSPALDSTTPVVCVASPPLPSAVCQSPSPFSHVRLAACCLSVCLVCRPPTARRIRSQLTPIHPPPPAAHEIRSQLGPIHLPPRLAVSDLPRLAARPFFICRD